jgi:hypothetical protein
MKTAAKDTEALWRSRVEAWRSSGRTAHEFAEAQGFTASALRYWSSRLSDAAKANPVVQVLPPEVPRAAPLPDVIVEVSGARIRVERGFDPDVLAAVVRTLGRGTP